MGWFSPKCPVDQKEKDWLEERMNWLLAQYGIEFLWDVQVVLPTPEFFPEAFKGSEYEARKLFRKIRSFMKVDEQLSVQLKFYNADKGVEVAPGICVRKSDTYAVGTYEQGGMVDTISIEREQLSNPIALIGTMAHELGHLHLLGDERLSGFEEDNEPLTDLLTVFMGLGVFTANSGIQESNWSTTNGEAWSISKQGYLSLRDYGYAFALFAYARQESNPAWAKHLRPDVKWSFKKGLKYLLKTGDTNFRAKKFLKYMNKEN